MMKIQRSLFLYCLRPGDFRKEAHIKGKKFTPHLLLITFEMVNIIPFTINVLQEYKSKCFREKQACYYPDWFVLFVCISSSSEKPLSRRARLAQLCTYLQKRYKHLCRQDRAATRHSRYRYAFRKALLYAASKDPDCTAQLIQKLSKSSQTSTWCVEHDVFARIVCISGLCVILICLHKLFKFFSSRSAVPHKYERTMCTGTTKGQSCSNIALPFSRHCFQRILQVKWPDVSGGLMMKLWIFSVNNGQVTSNNYVQLSDASVLCSWQHIDADILLNRSQQLFSSCTARFADGQQCSVPVFDITHQTPLCDEHAKKMVRNHTTYLDNLKRDVFTQYSVGCKLYVNVCVAG